MTIPAIHPAGSLTGRILVVDDIAANRLLLSDILEASGHEVITAVDGAEALARVRDNRPDLLLLDVGMPGVDGLEVCRRLRAAAETASLPIILVTAYTQREDRLAGITAGANDYLTKPIDRTDLLLRVRNALQMRRLHVELAERYEELGRLEQLRDSLVHMLVHDLRSPLTGLFMNLDLVRETVEGLDQPELLEDVEEMGRSVRQLADMVSDVLDVSRFEAASMPLTTARVDLRVLAAEAVALLGKVDGTQVEIHSPPDPVYALADADVIRRVTTNLVSNAVKFTPRGNSVALHIESAAAGPEVRVIDAGPGIAPEHHAEIFDKFGQVKGAGQHRRSTGLGLTFCRLAVEAHGGRIGVISEVGGGSTFWFRLTAA